MSGENQFTFKRSNLIPGVTALHAVMRDFSYARHAHEELAIGVTLAGRQDFFCKGVHFKSTPGKVILFNPEDAHDGHPGQRTVLEYAMLYIHPDAISPIIDSARLTTAPSPRLAGTLFDDPALRKHVLSLTRLIFDEHGSRLEQERSLYAIASRYAQRTGQYQPDQWTPCKDALLLRVREYIHANPDRDHSIDELSRVANLSKYHFIRLFRRQFGITPHQYVLSCRINRARNAMEQGCSPTTAAQMLGFTDASHLNRRFKEAYGITPKQYQTQFLR